MKLPNRPSSDRLLVSQSDSVLNDPESGLGFTGIWTSWISASGPLVWILAFVMTFSKFGSAEVLCQESFEKPPISYSQTKANDVIAQLARDIRKGKRSLEWDEKFGWLPSLLKLSVKDDVQAA